MYEHRISAASGILVSLATVGEYIRLGDAMPTCTVEVLEATKESQNIVGNKLTLSAGDAVKLRGTFTRIGIIQSSGVTVIISLLTGFGELIASRISGDVNATILQNNLSRKGAQFRAYLTSAAPVSFQYLQLWNPPTSGKILHIKRADASSASAAEVRCGTISAQLSGALSSANSFIINKLYSGSLGAPLVRAQDGSGLIAASEMHFRTKNGANTNGIGSSTYSVNIFDYKNDDGIIVEQGYGFTFETLAAGAVTVYQIDYEELSL